MTRDEAADAGRESRPAKRLRWVIPVLIGLIALALAGAEVYRLMSKASGVRYLTQKVTQGPIVRAVTTSGTVNPVITVQVGTYAASSRRDTATTIRL